MPTSLVRRRRSGAPATAGFTLIEILVTLLVFALVMGAVTLVLMNSARSKQRTMQRIESAQGARAALDLMARDIRSAGYGTDNDFNPPQPAIAYVDSEEIILSENQQPFPDGSLGPGVPLAYDPNGAPRPRPLDATAWTPPTRYRTGAELIRYTLDVNNDGVVDANDIASPQGADAAATPNPNDYVLVREVYGDSTGNVLGNEGGSQERIALVRKPGAGVPSMFTVYLKGSATPWDWSNGPVPENQLANIQRIEVQVTATASRPDSRGQFAQTTLVSDVNSMRSVPNFGAITYVVDGYIYNDTGKNNFYDAGTDPGMNGVTVRLGNQYVAYTNTSGYFAFHVPNGTYTLREIPPAGYGVETSPDSFVVTVASVGASRTFLDTVRTGGWVHLHAFNDLNSNGTLDAGEPPLQGILSSIIPGQLNANVAYSDLSGNDSLFASAANYSITTVPPDSMVVTSTNPILGLMTNGGSAWYNVGLNSQATGHVSGHVYRDFNRNGSYDGGETGLSNVWVGVSKDNGLTVSGYAYTDANGAYSITVPINAPPHVTPYSVYVLPPSGYFPTSPTSIGGLWVGNGNNLTNNDFGMAGYQVITLNASRVLSLIATDLIEKDWNGNQVDKRHQDVDLILGADAGGVDNVDVWFNYFGDQTSIFNATGSPDYTRLAPNSVMCMAADTLDNNGYKPRPDLVTGTRYTPGGNFFVWFTQGSNNNEGYLSTTYDPGQNYLTSDNGDVTGVVTLDCAGGPQPDIVVGTKSPTAGHGQIEVWQNDDATTPTFSRVETFTNVSGWQIGEINDMILTDLDNDGRKDLIITARFDDYDGQMIVFQNVSKVTGTRFVYRYGVSFGGNIPTAVAALDANGDGFKDLFVGTQRSTSQGMIYEFQNVGSSNPFSFTIPKAVNAPGIVATLCAGDFGGSITRKDLACGWRSTTTGFGGGVVIYFMDGGLLPDTGVDPSGGAIANFVPALAAANFNFGLNTITPPSPFLTDLAVGIKSSSTTGALVVFVR